MNSQSFPIREARPGDLAALAQLHVDTFNETHSRGARSGPTFEVRERQWREALNSRTGNFMAPTTGAICSRSSRNARSVEVMSAVP